MIDLSYYHLAPYSGAVSIQLNINIVPVLHVEWFYLCSKDHIFSFYTFFPVRYVYPLCTGYYSLNGLPKFVSFCFFSPTMGVHYAQQIWILFVTICVVCTLNIYWNISNIFIWQNSFFDEIYEFVTKKCMFSIHLLHFFLSLLCCKSYCSCQRDLW